VVPHQRGFIAVQSKSLSVFKGTSGSTLARTLTSKARPGQFNRLQQFDDVRDVAVNSQQVRRRRQRYVNVYPRANLLCYRYVLYLQVL